MRGTEDFPGEEEDYNKVDLKDIEFRMKNDGRKVQELLHGSKAYGYKDLTILKLILSSGLYPQLVREEVSSQGQAGKRGCKIAQAILRRSCFLSIQV